MAALFEPSVAITVATLVRIGVAVVDHMSWELCGPSTPATVTALGVVIPTERGYVGHGLAAVFSAKQYGYFAGCPCVDASPSRGRPPPLCKRMSRMARPVVALARLPGPNVPKPALYPALS